MSEAVDIRIMSTLPGHPKTKRLIRRVGTDGAWRLIRLFLWVRENHSDGDLSGKTTEDLELAVDWAGEPDALVKALLEVGFLEGTSGAYRIHDWEEHNPWSFGAEKRGEKSRWASLCKHHGRAEAARMMPEYAARLAAQEAAKAETGSKDGQPPKVPEVPPAPKTGANGSHGHENPASGMPGSSKTAPPSPSPLPFPSPLPGEGATPQALPVAGPDPAAKSPARDDGGLELIPESWKPPDWIATRLMTACIAFTPTAATLAHFIAHHRAKRTFLTRSSWGEEFLTWCIREARYEQRDAVKAKPGGGGLNAPDPEAARLAFVNGEST